MKGPNNKAYVVYSKKYPKWIIQYGLHDLLKRKERMLCPKNMYVQMRRKVKFYLHFSFPCFNIGSVVNPPQLISQYFK